MATAWLRHFQSLLIPNPHHPLSRLYTTGLNRAARSKWWLEGVPPPKSILEDDDDSDAKIDLSEDSELVNGAHPDGPLPHQRTPPEIPTPHQFKEHRKTLQKRFPDGWSPPKKLSREAMDGLRQLHRFDPEKFSTPVLAEKFRISPEAVRRILKSRWEPSREKKIKLAERERQARSERIRLTRLKEEIEAKEVEQVKRMTEGAVGGRTRTRTTAKDGFTFV
ncbi:hypothetical protein AX17_002474 [Amanita inopinata Kibby_2008]|nr:hypothetical protein AX17_002474 [Amanita inopinata Kibby_2008]